MSNFAGEEVLMRAGQGRRWRRLFLPLPHRGVRWWFLRSLGLVHAVAFTSLGRQVLGLYGRRGILPVGERLAGLRARYGTAAPRAMPSYLWWASSDRALKAGCRVGQLLSAALLLNVAPRAALAGLYGLYLSFVNAGGEFMSFQWDVLLLETTAHALLAAPGGWRPGRGRREPSVASVLMFRWLLMRLYAESGLTKLESGDRTWRELTACCHYYETAPLPTRAGWYAHHLPRSAQRASTLATLAIESGAPLLMLGPRRARLAAFGAVSILQAAIALTGNYGFFNLLTAVLHLWLLDDAALGKGRRSRGRAGRSAWRSAVAFGLAAPLMAITLPAMLSRRWWSARLPAWVESLRERARPFLFTSSYGLFSVMTLERPEVVVEGSDDSERWAAYDFRFKAGNPNRPPRQVAPHQPRLDWQMWFAALTSPPRWFYGFLTRLLEGSPPVLALLAHNPFPNAPPRFIRAELYDYRMTSLAERRRTGRWWQRRRVGSYVSPITLAPPSRGKERPWPPGPAPRA